MPKCSECQHFIKQTIEITGVPGNFKTWINFEDPANPGSGFYDIAVCDHGSTTNGDITRDNSTLFFFSPPYNTIFDEQTVAGENDSCPNFTAI
jgi:hypothetical protein